MESTFAIIFYFSWLAVSVFHQQKFCVDLTWKNSIKRIRLQSSFSLLILKSSITSFFLKFTTFTHLKFTLGILNVPSVVRLPGLSWFVLVLPWGIFRTMQSLEGMNEVNRLHPMLSFLFYAITW